MRTEGGEKFSRHEWATNNQLTHSRARTPGQPSFTFLFIPVNPCSVKCCKSIFRSVLNICVLLHVVCVRFIGAVNLFSVVHSVFCL